ncbi:MAG TPA: hypothetical protein HPP54_09935 [Nitrospinae bacterium]|nr:hypothetical protein [Nitrospinota bacterium]
MTQLVWVFVTESASVVADNMEKSQVLQRLSNETLCETIQKIPVESQKIRPDSRPMGGG